MSKTQNASDMEQLLSRYEDLEFLNNVEDFLCVKCKRVAIVHNVANCNHLFCNSCQNLLRPDTESKCPKCNQPITHYNNKDTEIGNRITETNIRCPNAKYGCQEITKLRLMTDHMKNCKNTREASLPAIYRGTNSMHDAMVRLGEIGVELKNIKNEITNAQNQTEAKLLKEIKKFDELQRKDMEVKFDQLERRIKGLSSDFFQEINGLNKKFEEANVKDIQSLILKIEENFKNLKKELLECFTAMFKDTKQKLDTIIEDTQDIKSHYNKTTKSKRCINILLLGETMNGKSTLINAFASYIKHGSFDEALKSNDEPIIATKFTTTDEEFNEIIKTCGIEDYNECMEALESTTRECKSYLFTIREDLQVRWIDTSGFGATWGPEHDEASSKDIAQQISQYEAIHAIAIVSKVNTYRLTTQIEYCLQQVLCILHKSAIPNIICICTHGTDPLATIKTIRTEATNFQINLVINKSNTFSFENEGFITLLGLKMKIEVSEEDIEKSRNNWKSAAVEYNRLLTYISSLPAYDVTSTLEILEINALIENVYSVLKLIRSDISEVEKALDDEERENDSHLTKLKENEQQMLDALSKFYRYLEAKALIPFNMAKKNYINDQNKKDLGVNNVQCNPSDVSSDIDINHQQSQTDKLPVVTYNQIQKIKKQLFVMKAYGAQLVLLCEEDKSNKQKTRNEKEIKINSNKKEYHQNDFTDLSPIRH